MSHRYTLSLTDDLDKQLSHHPDAKQHKTPTAFMRHIIEDWLQRNSHDLLLKIQALLTKAELTYINEQHAKETYHYNVIKQFKKDAIIPRTLFEITQGIYIMKRNVFKELNLPLIDDLKSGIINK